MAVNIFAYFSLSLDIAAFEIYKPHHSAQTWFSTVGIGFIGEVTTVIISIADPVLRNTTAIGTFELHVRTRRGAAHLVTTILTVIVCNK